ncbi:unnamed protein product [Caenorhabditis auriculariae]|uniref:Bardet-Biedl syndrome 1 N-terminal domain-containing protein n=1 Tax=Caenorhabditis auriculariae TaxID=2777116 RepID=A0A8S1GPE4_9PELO|nr:unnamed protein product [Caenorhabditis auriculariae]
MVIQDKNNRSWKVMESSSKWTSPVSLQGAEVHCSKSCVALGDLFSDGDSKLIVAHGGQRGMNMRLKVFKGVSQMTESSLADQPIAIAHFINELSSLPSVAVAAGSSLLIYKNLKPFYKFTVPSSEVNGVEKQAWQAAASGQLPQENLYTVIQNLAEEVSSASLTSASQTLLLVQPNERRAFFDKYLNKPLTNSAAITCLTKMEKSTAEVIDVLLIGTEHGKLHVVDSQAFTHLTSCSFPSPPVQIVTYGSYDVDYRVFVLTRDAMIYAVKRTQTSCGRPLVVSTCPILSMVRMKKLLVTASSDNTVNFYNFKGKKITEVRCDKKPIMLENFEYTQKQFTAVLVMFEQEIRMYNENYLLDVLKFDKPLSWIKYGHYGREEGALVICFKDGSVCVRMFRRKANFDEKRDLNPHPATHTLKLAIPKKTKLFIDQSVRERDHGDRINQTYQKDLFLLRCRVAESYAEVSTTASSSVAADGQLPVDITVDVHGFGPVFRLIIYVVSNAKADVFGLWLSIMSDPAMYTIEEPLIPVSLLAPSHKYSFTTLLNCVDPEKATQEELRVLLIHEKKQAPIVTAVVKMPISEMPVD